MRPSARVPIMHLWTTGAFIASRTSSARVGSTRWLEDGIAEIEAYLAKHAAFLTFLDTAESAS